MSKTNKKRFQLSLRTKVEICVLAGYAVWMLSMIGLYTITH